MHKIVCLALGHRLRVVQEFTAYCRRIKCVRCGGDWGMHDVVRVMRDWSPELEQLHRNEGWEILEPLPEWHSFAVERLTWGELCRAVRWPGALAFTLGCISGNIIQAVAGTGAVSYIATTALALAIGRFAAKWAIDRADERKRNSLEA